MLIITMKNGYELIYKGRINLAIDEEYPNLLWVTAELKEGKYHYYNWHSCHWDNLLLTDIISIKGTNNE